ncbi:MAG: hypothetical protein ABSA44_10615 [Bacteroidota bacterium]|jgi:hypothetical protein
MNDTDLLNFEIIGKQQQRQFLLQHPNTQVPPKDGTAIIDLVEEVRRFKNQSLQCGL